MYELKERIKIILEFGVDNEIKRKWILKQLEHPDRFITLFEAFGIDEVE